QERIIKAVEFGRAVVHYGWIPFIIYIGYTRSNPQPSLIKYVAETSTPQITLTSAQVD
ncbi:hypothetical protein FOMPIDRAFT_1131415, partial [Fomitopsis schrenkii]